MTDPTDLLDFFLAKYTPTDGEIQAEALRTAVRVGFGTWMCPEDATTAQRPATHLHEITVYSVSATGETARAAVSNWFRVANRINTSQVAA